MKLQIKIFLVILITVSITSCFWQGIEEDAPKRYVVYVPYTELDKSIEMGVFDKATYINISFFNPTAIGEYEYKENISQLQEYIIQAHNNEVKVLLSIGGGISKESPLVAIYHDLLKSNSNRALLVDNLIAFVELLDADGIDNDLEDVCIDIYYNTFVKQLYEQLHPKGRIITAAVAPYTSYSISSKTFERYEFINLMAYDYTGLGSDEPGLIAGEDRLSRELFYYCGVRGIHPHKMVVGLPFYGYWWKQDSNGKTVKKGAIAYKTLVTEYPQKVVLGDILKIEVDGFTTTYSFNCMETVKRKTETLSGYGGMMCWHFTMDSADETTSLSNVVVQAQK